MCDFLPEDRQKPFPCRLQKTGSGKRSKIEQQKGTCSRFSCCNRIDNACENERRHKRQKNRADYRTENTCRQIFLPLYCHENDRFYLQLTLHLFSPLPLHGSVLHIPVLFPSAPYDFP